MRPLTPFCIFSKCCPRSGTPIWAWVSHRLRRSPNATPHATTSCGLRRYVVNRVGVRRWLVDQAGLCGAGGQGSGVRGGVVRVVWEGGGRGVKGPSQERFSAGTTGRAGSSTPTNRVFVLAAAQGALVLTGLMSLPPRDLIKDTLPTLLLSSPHVPVMAEFGFEPACLSSDWCL